MHRSLFRYTRLLPQLYRYYSIKNSPKIAITDDGSTYVIWHPKTDFPYEATKPIPVAKVEDTSVLKTQLSAELMSIFNKKTADQARAELMNITHTTKHRWFPKARSKKRKQTPMDRQYL